MTIEQAVLQQLQTLSLEKKQEVLDFVEFLQAKRTVKRQRRNPIGLFADLKLQITAQDIDDARHEMWANFPSEITLYECSCC